MSAASSAVSSACTLTALLQMSLSTVTLSVLSSAPTIVSTLSQPCASVLFTLETMKSAIPSSRGKKSRSSVRFWRIW